MHYAATTPPFPPYRPSPPQIQAISAHYASSHCQYIDVEGTSQEVVLKEVQDVVRKRLGSDAKITLPVS